MPLAFSSFSLVSGLLPPRPLRVAIIGATGAVGRELLSLLYIRQFPVAELILLASPKSIGKVVTWNQQKITVQKLDKKVFKGIDLVFVSAGSDISHDWAPIAVQYGALVIDNSSAFRRDLSVPLIVPEINPQSIINHQGIISNPNCTTVLLTLILGPLQDQHEISRVFLSTYQSVSGAGTRAMQELKDLSLLILNEGSSSSNALPYSLAFNLFLHNSPMQLNGYCEEEMKMVNETRKIMDLPSLNISASCVRVPILRAHSESINIIFKKSVSLDLIRAILTVATSIELIEDFAVNRFPMPSDVNGRDSIAVGRLRKGLNDPKSLELWLCGDQIRKGAALNAIQIAELLLPKGLKKR